MGSASLQEKVQYWKSFWKNKGFKIIAYPSIIPIKTFIKEYSQIHKDFFKNIEKADSVFVMNENKNGVIGYIGAESFAEMAFAVTQNLIHNKTLGVILLKMPDNRVQSYDEIVLWLKLGWIKLYEENINRIV